MKITADTTEEQILAPVKHALQNLQELAVSYHNEGWADLDTLVAATNNVAEQQGRAQVRRDLHNALALGDGVDDEDFDQRFIRHALSMLARGADDTWSGRKNDARRAYFDGLRDEIRTIVLMGSGVRRG